MFRCVRVRTVNADRFVRALRKAGFVAEFQGAGTASVQLNGGCADPEHCDVHQSFWEPLEWGSIHTNASGRKAHRVFAACLRADQGARP